MTDSGINDPSILGIAMANVTSGVTVADARLPDMPLVYVNKGFEEITGYSAEEVLGKSCRFLQGEEPNQPGLTVLRKAIQAGAPCIVRLRNFRKDGSLFYNELRISPVHNDADELTHFVGVQLDVTDRVRMRESLEKSEERYRKALESEMELSGIKSRFISMVSHEFRTPMTGIGASSALLRKYGDSLPAAKIEAHFQNIEASLKRMNRLLDDVLFFGQGESNTMQAHLESIDLSNFLIKFVERWSHVYPTREIKFESALPSGFTCRTDPHLLENILQNLLRNALKYSKLTSQVKFSVRENPPGMEFSISDQGIGISIDDQKKLFQAFHRGANVGTRQGTGLGLSIVKRATELLNGNVSFSSQESVGSTFCVTLPKDSN